ncbi:lysophospholipase L1-like esterase [Chitinophaga dinghuensis]|uniref:Lysophospholipase L1-like esterase n=1 Tax=Chitinophaga dinghuensis TaxID=1539050 RepID=A0A327W8P8_9BACT|nr:GDSL-type esterase/lipase family protein [Chitinophaga dinghuensis]RAJ86004.1 lysophospholipase L1-like esterase [Chitinophaga dinghuensis]
MKTHLSFMACGIVLSTLCNAQVHDTAKAAFDSTYHNYLYDSRLAYFKGLPDTKNEIIFLGNSITHWGDWAELTGNPHVRNRGIAGDISYGILARMDEVLSSQPAKIFLMIGVNDIGRKIPLALTLQNYRRILAITRSVSPTTKIYIQSVLPINESIINRDYYTGTNEEIRTMNAAVKALAVEQQIPFINLYDLLADKDGQMPAAYTYDGIHLTAAAYIRWTNYLRQHHYL